jgi:periplasmic protein TonB
MKSSHTIISFLFVSAAIHAGLMIVTDNTTAKIILPANTGSMMTVKIVSLNKPAIKIVPQQTKIEKSKQQAANKPLTRNKDMQVSRSKTVRHISQHKKEQQIAAISQARVISVLVQELKQYFTYPKLAKKRNWQGKVLLALRITPSGNLENIHLAGSSGYNILDEAALRAIHQVKTLPKLQSQLKTNLKIEVPILYQLIEG